MDERAPAHRRIDDLSAVSVRDMVLDHDRKIDLLVGWQNEIRGAFALMKVAFGASILSAVISVVAVVQMMSGKP